MVYTYEGIIVKEIFKKNTSIDIFYFYEKYKISIVNLYIFLNKLCDKHIINVEGNTISPTIDARERIIADRRLYLYIKEDWKIDRDNVPLNFGEIIAKDKEGLEGDD